MKIPVLNIYYMLSYSWNILDEAQIIKIDKSDYESLKQLLAKLLAKGTSSLIRRGLDRAYSSTTELYSGIKGKLNFNESIRRNVFRNGKSVSDFDTFDFNTPHNQIIKATIYNLLDDSEIEKDIHNELKKSYLNLHKVKLINLRNDSFKKVQLNRNNKYYNLMINICRVIFDNSVVNERNGKIVFQDFDRDDKKMARLFESFLFNFYKSKREDFKVSREIISWDFVSISAESESFLPKMKTDITIEDDNKKIIIDAKYYSNTLINNFNKDIFHSSNLYQLFSYILNQESKSHAVKNYECTGILIYPKVENHLSEKYLYKKHKILINTIDLTNDWFEIENNLIKIVNSV